MKWPRIVTNRWFRSGVPMILFVVIGSFGLAEFTEIRVKKRDQKTHMLTAQESLKFQKIDVEEEFRKMQQKLDIDNWENKRGPRPWEPETYNNR